MIKCIGYDKKRKAYIYEDDETGLRTYEEDFDAEEDDEPIIKEHKAELHPDGKTISVSIADDIVPGTLGLKPYPSPIDDMPDSKALTDEWLKRSIMTEPMSITETTIPVKYFDPATMTAIVDDRIATAVSSMSAFPPTVRNCIICGDATPSDFVCDNCRSTILYLRSLKSGHLVDMLMSDVDKLKFDNERHKELVNELFHQNDILRTDIINLSTKLLYNEENNKNE